MPGWAWAVVGAGWVFLLAVALVLARASKKGDRRLHWSERDRLDRVERLRLRADDPPFVIGEPGTDAIFDGSDERDDETG